jgi:hypothetical protein
MSTQQTEAGGDAHRRSAPALAKVLLFGALGLIAAHGASARISGLLPLRIGGVERSFIGPGLERVELRLERGLVDAGRMVVLFAALDQVDVALSLNADARPLSRVHPDALAVTNGGFFTPERRPTGLLVHRGEVLAPLVASGGAAGSGVLVVEAGRVELLTREVAAGRSFEQATLALQAGPRLVEPDGRPGIKADDGVRANRTAAGRDGHGRLAVAVTYDEDAGVTLGPSLFELMTLLGKEGLGQVDPALALQVALNLDGGPSTGLSLRGVGGALELVEGAAATSVLALGRGR